MITPEEIRVSGSITIGSSVDLVERVAESRDVDGLRFRQTLQLALVASEQTFAFQDEGLTQGYVVFGQPGAGKTHFLRGVLRQLLALHDADADRRFGGLIIDPKADYPKFVSEYSRQALGRSKVPPIVIRPDMPKALNLLHCGLSPDSLAKIVAATVTALARGGDSYFHDNLAVVLTSILVAERIVARREPRRVPSLRFLLELITGSSDDAKGQRVRQLEIHVKYLQSLLHERSGHAWTPEERAEIHRCIDNLRAFLQEDKAYVAIQLFKQAFEPFQRLGMLCGDTDYDAPNFYDDILNSGRVVVVSIPPSETYARAVFTLVKNIFQKVVLDRFARYSAEGGPGRIRNRVRPVFLICDEYHLSASDAPECAVGDSSFLSLARSFGCFSLFATQGLDQLKNSAIAERWEAIIGLFRAKFFFTVGDVATATLAADLAGEEPSLFVGASSNEGRDGKSWGASDQLTTRQHLPRYVLLRSLARGQAAVVGTLDGRSAPEVRVVRIGGA